MTTFPRNAYWCLVSWIFFIEFTGVENPWSPVVEKRHWSNGGMSVRTASDFGLADARLRRVATCDAKEFHGSSHAYYRDSVVQHACLLSWTRGFSVKGPSINKFWLLLRWSRRENSISFARLDCPRRCSCNRQIS